MGTKFVHLDPELNRSDREMKKVMATDLSSCYRGTQDALKAELAYLEKEDQECVYAKLALEAAEIRVRGNHEEQERSESLELPGSQKETTAPNELPSSQRKALIALFGNSFTERERKSSNESAREEVMRYRTKESLPLTENTMA